MDIKARIHARKVTLIYFYEILFFEYMRSNTHVFDDADKVEKLLNRSPLVSAEHLPPKTTDPETLSSMMRDMSSPYTPEQFDDNIAYIIRNHFDNIPPENIDIAYIQAVGATFDLYAPQVEEKVNEYATSFTYKQMDLMDRAIFVLWYAEWKELGTPKEVVLNEMIELAKRYGDESSAKLINGIGHKILQATSDK